jgi:beta-glucosidase/6-phospho-beta-glucosidase/beta-galactosidase
MFSIAIICCTGYTALAAKYPLYDMPNTIADGSFPKSFKFGVSTSSYQVEGGWLEGGKGPTSLDVAYHIPGNAHNNDNGDIANDMYHLYPQDIAQMKSFGIQHYRFSINWARILPTGVLPINQGGVDYYNDLINQLLAAGIEPHVTLYHGEIPEALQMYPNPSNIFLNQDKFVQWFTDYADVAFGLFGDRVNQWYTFNEPFCISVYGSVGDKDPYSTAHSLILAHASAYRLYESKYKSKLGGTVGIVLNTMHFYPLDESSPSDAVAAERGYDFWYHWYLGPLTAGRYPQTMIDTVGARLPTFTADQQVMITGALDFVAINYYFPYVVSPGTASDADQGSFYKDLNITTGFSDWPLSQTGWGIYAPGLRDLLLYTQERYPGLPQHVTENGLAWEETEEEAINDTTRQKYLHDHIDAVGEAIQKGVNIQSYFVWSLQDNLEWNSGFSMTFGLTYIERPSLVRVPKGSLYWYSEALALFANTGK